MSVTPMRVGVAGPLSGQPRRVRDEVKDGMAVIAFSAASSSALAVVLTFLVHLAD